VSKSKKQYVYLLLDKNNKIHDVARNRGALDPSICKLCDPDCTLRIIKAEVQIGESNSKK
jgi:hypothetical protein